MPDCDAGGVEAGERRDGAAGGRRSPIRRAPPRCSRRSSGRLVELKVGLGDRVSQGQVLAVIDSPDLAQAYDDDEKAADAFKLTERNLGRQEAQNKIGRRLGPGSGSGEKRPCAGRR